MGTSHSAVEYAAKMSLAAAAAVEAAAEATDAAALLMKRSILAGAPSRLRHVGKNGSPLNVRYTSGTYPDGAKALVFAVGRGWPIIERDTKAHAIPRLAGTRSGFFGPAFAGVSTRRRKPLAFGNGEFAAHVRSPGTKGKHPFEHGVDRTIPLIPLQYASRQLEGLRTIF